MNNLYQSLHDSNEDVKHMCREELEREVLKLRAMTQREKTLTVEQVHAALAAPADALQNDTGYCPICEGPHVGPHVLDGDAEATVTLDGDTRRVCNNPNCGQDYQHGGPCDAPASEPPAQDVERVIKDVIHSYVGSDSLNDCWAGVEPLLQQARIAATAFIPGGTDTHWACGHSKWSAKGDCITCLSHAIDYLNAELSKVRVELSTLQSTAQSIEGEALDRAARICSEMKRGPQSLSPESELAGINVLLQEAANAIRALKGKLGEGE